jgi:CRISPR-associated protein Cas1
MATLYLDRKGLELERDGGRMMLYSAGGKGSGIPLTGISRIVIRGNVTVSTGLLGTLAEQGIGVLMLSGRHSRRTACLFGRPHADVVRRLGQYRLFFDPAQRLAWSWHLIAAKLMAQQRGLRQALASRPDRRKVLTGALRSIELILSKVGDADNLEVLNGYEGAAAAAYFRGYGALFPPELAFTKRTRRPPTDPVNACLSLAYTLVHFDAVQTCQSAGLDPFVGFFHQPAYGRESLACDLIEPLRPRIDAWVWRLFRQRILRAEDFRQEGSSACLLGKAGRQRFYTDYEASAPCWRRWLRQQSRIMARRVVELSPRKILPAAEEPWL